MEALLEANTLGLIGSGLLVRRELGSRAGGFDPAIRVGEDWDWAVRLRLLAPIEVLAQPLCRIRFHHGNVWRLLTPDRIEPALSDHLRVLEKAFALVPDEPRYRDLQRRASARAYAEAGLAALAWAQYERASQWLAEAESRDPGVWADPTHLGDRYRACLGEVEERSGVLSPGDLGARLRAASAALPFVADSPRVNVFREHVLAGLYFDGAKAGDYRRVRWVLPRLLASRPAWVRNRGVWAIAVRAFVCQPTTHLFRPLLHAGGRQARRPSGETDL